MLLSAFMAICSLLHGLDIVKDKGFKLPVRALYAIPFGLPYLLTGHYILGSIAVIISFFAIATGHGIALPWGNLGFSTGYPDQAQEIMNGRKQRIQPIVDWLAEKLGIERHGVDGLYSKNYCRLFMSVKGFLVGLPVGGIITAITWPLSYEIGHRLKCNYVSELLCGASAGIVISLMVF